jgi:hypothetical protein
MERLSMDVSMWLFLHRNVAVAAVRAALGGRCRSVDDSAVHRRNTTRPRTATRVTDATEAESCNES